MTNYRIPTIYNPEGKCLAQIQGYPCDHGSQRCEQYATNHRPVSNAESPKVRCDDPFTTQHCAAWCESAGIGAEWIPTLVQALADDGPDSTMSWPSVARYVGATYTDGIEYR